MILVDTSVWIGFLTGNEPYASELDHLLSRDEVLGHDFVHGELLIGDLGRRAKLLDAYVMMSRAARVDHREVVEFVKRRHLAGRGIGWIDAHLLASALVEHAALWTADRNLSSAARDLGVAYRRRD